MKAQLLFPILGGFLLIASSQVAGTTFTVTNTSDSGPGSLRDALNQANSTTGTDTIVFQIPGSGPHTILPNSQLPQLIDQAGVLMDGLSQSGATPGINPPSTAVLKIGLTGLNAGASHGLCVLSSNNTIRGLIINNFQQDGIRIEATQSGSFNNYIYCNLIGTDSTGTIAQGNGTNQQYLWSGITITAQVASDQIARYAYENRIDSNLISANYVIGISMLNQPPGDVHSNTITGNYIGTDITGTVAFGNLHCGIYIEGAHDNSISKCLISGNIYEGMSIEGYGGYQMFAYNNMIFENTIGLDVNLSPLPNGGDGICLGEYFGTLFQGGYVINNQIGPDNTIAANGGNGLSIWEHPMNNSNADGNRITRNAIYENSGLGIDLCDNGVTMNDASDLDDGSNEEKNFPVILSADYSAGQTTITGTVDTNPISTVVEVFKAKPDPTGHGEGEIYLDQTVPDNLGNWTIITSALLPGNSVTATATDTTTMNTSEFCLNVSVIDVGVGVNTIAQKHMHYEVYQSYPNPFNASTVISYQLSKEETVIIKIFNHLGKEVRTLIHEQKNAGFHEESWDGTDQSGHVLSSGVYFYRIETESFTQIKKAILIK